MADGFLSPYRVLDLTDDRGLLAGRILGQLGADVVQVEPVSGSPARSIGPFTSDPAPDNSLYWSAYASAKRGLACDLDSPAGRNLVLRLAAESDENARLRKALDEARAKLEAVTHIERSINDRGTSGSHTP